jgi:hypothetical protein
MSNTLINPYDMPGMGDAVVSTEREFTWGKQEPVLITGVMSSAAVDAGNSPTTQLRRGLLVGQVTSSLKYKEYNPTGTDGSQIVAGVLFDNINMLNFRTGSAEDKRCVIMVGGNVKAAQLLLLDVQARQQMYGRFLFDDMLQGIPATYTNVVAKTADYTVSASTDNGKLFTNQGASGAVNFTLPAVAQGLKFAFFVEANQNLTVTAPAGKLVAFNNATATSISFSTSSEKVGAMVEVYANADGTKYLTKVSLGAETQTPTIA